MSEAALPSAKTLAEQNSVRFPNESPQYRAARTALLAEEIELRRHLERVAEMRRALPPGGEVRGDYKFVLEDGSTVDLPALFGDKQTLVTYSYMFGPQRQRPCPMCTNLLDTLDGTAPSIEEQAALVVIARSSIDKLLSWKRERGWKNLRLVSDVNDNYSRDYFGVSPAGDDIPALNIFTRRDGIVRHFWSGEMTGSTADPGQDPRGAPDLSPLWTILDTTPDGRPATWYPRLNY
jgi:predicted dithiol-disulfide oxidoreductase (DUF899 family)